MGVDDDGAFDVRHLFAESEGKMPGQTIGGLFKDPTRGETALAELKKAGFTSAQISELADDESAAPAKKLSNPMTDFFQDHTTTGSEFQNNLTGLGISDADAKYFEDGVARGGALVTVKGDARASEAVQILQRYDADLGSQGRSDVKTAPVAGAAGAATRTDAEERTIQLKAERLAVDKVRVATGAARITKRVVTEQRSVDVPVMREELVIERHPVTGAAPSGTIGTDETISVPLSREEVKVSKQTFATEEVEIGKRVVGDTEHVSETVRHEELVVDKDGKPQAPKR